MKIGDLVMWVGTNQDYGCLGIVIGINDNGEAYMGKDHYTVIWCDGLKGSLILKNELKMVIDE
tara:strand:- start:223 stop:411 length:189 start_codon:yes stop_codon:yes gene_type:complete